MLRIAGLKTFPSAVRRGGATAFALALAISGAGCSTDFRRLEQPTLGMNEGGPRPSEGIRRGVGAPIGSDQAWSDSGPRAPLPPVTRAEPATLPPHASAGPVQTGPSASLPNTGALSKPFDRPKTPIAATPVGGARIPSGGSVEVQSGDSLYSIAKRNNVSIAALMEVNQLKSPNLKPGQKLVLPATPGARKPAVRVETKVASAGGALPSVAPVVTPGPAAPAPALVPSSPASEWAGSYVIKSGDSLYAVARSHKIALAELQRVNGISDPTKVRPGTVLKVPGPAGTPSSIAEPSRTVVVAAPTLPAPAVAAPAQPAAATPGTGTTTSPRIINVQPAAVPVAPPVEPSSPPASVPPVEKPPVVTTAAPSAGAAAANAKFRWPAQGQVLSGFGKRPDGTQNDGIDIAVPAGTDVRAASAGTVAYAGSELKGYGNLILLRHDNGWVSAYAHASEILVKRGDTVTSGQVIAKSGQTGTVSQPQLHFELRQGSKPVDPTPHLQK